MDLDQIKQSINLIEYAKRLGQLKKVGPGKYWLNPCPVCGHKDHFTIFEDTNSYSSFSKCCNGGTVIDFMIEVEGLDKKSAIDKIKELSGFQEIAAAAENLTKKEKAQPTQLEPVRDYTSLISEAQSHSTQYYYSRGLTDKTIKKYKLGYLPDGGPYGRDFKYVIPVSRNHIIFRSDNPDGDRYRNTKGEIDIFNKQYLTEPPNDKFIYITEGVFDALSIEEVDKAAIALNSTSNKNKLLELVAQNKDKLGDIVFILAGDNDDAGEKLNQELMEKLQEANLTCECLKLPDGYKDLNQLLKVDRASFSKAVEPSELYRGMTKDYSKEFALTVVKTRNQKPIRTGFNSLDEKLGGGLFPGLYALGAISSLGKTSLILQIADYIAKANDVLFFSLEMSKFELVAKSLSRELFKANPRTAVGTREVMRGEFVQEDMKKALLEYTPTAEHMAIIEGMFDTGTKEIRQEINKIIKFRQSRPVVIIDYLQILKPHGDRMSDKQAMDLCTAELKRISRDYNVPVIAISSFNRENYLQGVSFESFKESGAIEYSSDVIMGLQLAGMEEIADMADKKKTEKRQKVNELKAKNPREIELIILKNRLFTPFTKQKFIYYPKFNFFKEQD